jgi:hypothetical protein
MDYIEVIVTAVPEFFEWMVARVEVLVRAVPDFGVPIPVALLMFGFLLLMAWQMKYV